MNLPNLNNPNIVRTDAIGVLSYLILALCHRLNIADDCSLENEILVNYLIELITGELESDQVTGRS